GAAYLPYVMPFVGTWTQAAMDLPATTGKNTTDNVEQVYLAAPPAAGVYRCVVSLTGTLTNSEQRYALLITGAANVAPPPPPLTIASISPASALPGGVSFTLTGTGFNTSTVVKLRRAGAADATATGLQLVNDTLVGQLNLAAAPVGVWNVVAINADAETYTLAAAFTIQSALWSESFDGTVSGWTSQATTGSNAWAISTAQSYSPVKSYFVSAPATKTTCNLSTPAIAVPAAATGLQFKFWHRFDLQSARDGGRLEFSVDGGAWYDVLASGSGASFASNGYTTTLSQSGNPNNRSDFAGLRAWSGSSGGFIETILNLTDTAKYAGHTLRARWLLATDSSTSGAGWYVDSVALIGGGAVNYAPTITAGPVSSSVETVTDPDGTLYYVVRGTSTALSVTATDDGGEGLVTYTWSAVSASAPPVSFSSNAMNAAKNTSATFEGSGDYAVTVTVRDALGLAASGVVNVRVLSIASGLDVAPAAASVTVGGQQAFTATVLDQFGLALATQPGSFGWSASGGGIIGTSGVFSAVAAGGPFTVVATSGNYTATASVTVNPASATVTLSNLIQTYDGQPKPAGIITNPANLAVTVTYDGVGIVPVAVGSYAVSATVSDPNYQGAASGTLVIQPRRFTLTLAAFPAEGGAASGAGTFDEGMTVPISAVPAGGWRFTGWSGAVPLDPSAAVTTVTMDADRSLVATFVAKTGYELWAEAHALSGEAAAPLSDADGDGLANLLEYATVGDPTQPGSSPISIEVVNGALTFAFPRVADPALVYTVEASNEPGGPWTALAVEGNPSTGAANLAGLVVFTDSVPLADQPRRFLRLRVDY
ncbi:MAG: hypothetical protein RIQ79_944, partial [Verrucomicrobiota bacterium]